MAVFTPLTKKDVQDLLRDYELGELLDLRGISAGIENSNFFLDTTTGAYVLTVFEVLTREQLPFYIQLMYHLSKKGVAVPEPQVRLDGQMLSTLHGKPAVIASKLAGSFHPLPTIEQIREVAKLQAQAHLATADFPLTQPNLRGLSWWQATYPKIKPFLTEAQCQLYEACLAEQEAFFASDDYKQLPAGACHCDLFRDNVLLEADRVGGMIDFYFAGCDKYLFDIAVAINDWCVDRSNEANPTLLRSDLVQAWLSAYETVRPLTAQEQASLPIMLRAAALRFWTSRLYDFYLPRPAQDLKPHDPTWFEDLLKNRLSDSCRKTPSFRAEI